jgi:hypothetical protein
MAGCARVEVPSTSSELPMIEPAMEARTTSVRPAASAVKPMMISAALPKVALSSPPTLGPTRSVSASVAAPIRPASGTSPSAASRKTVSGGACAPSAISAAGTASSKA